MATIECYYCHVGRFQSECPKKPQDSRANYVERGEEAMLHVAQYSTDEKSNAQDMWFIDLGCSNHMIVERTRFPLSILPFLMK
ncbi:Retrovirus-related Pol polyprotein from transposon TNT 1-94 [Sesbania bispinosa]|nr:Retrovirus-related Pol polyprotein from transposon TNT 1-94 [Sesbania bispinosa]